MLKVSGKGLLLSSYFSSACLSASLLEAQLPPVVAHLYHSLPMLLRDLLKKRQRSKVTLSRIMSYIRDSVEVSDNLSLKVVSKIAGVVVR